MQKRVLIPEQMDDPDLDRHAHELALRGLRRINAWTRNAALAWQYVAQVGSEVSDRPLRVLDVATGSADIPIALMKMSASRGVGLEVDACDISDQALAVAAENCSAANVAVRLFRHDILRDDVPKRYDVIMCSQFLHHLTSKDAASVLRKMKSASTHRVLVVDLERSRLNWLQVWFATRVLSRSKVVHFDGPQSVRAAFTVSEFRTLAQELDFASFAIHKKWPCRFVMVGELDA